MLLTNIEIDIFKTKALKDASEMASKYKCPAIVVPPELYGDANIIRAVVHGTYKIMVAIDWERNGVSPILEKFRGVPAAALDADGYEVLLAPGDLRATRKQLRELVSFFQNYFAPTIEIRPVFGYHLPDRPDEVLAEMAQALTVIPTPSLVRTTHLTKVPVAKGSIATHQAIMDTILSVKRVPLKISGNVNHKVISGCPTATRYAATPEQANSIIRALRDKAARAQ